MTDASFFQSIAESMRTIGDGHVDRAKRQIEEALRQLDAGYFEDAVAYLNDASKHIHDAESFKEKAALLVAVADKLAE